MNQKDSLWPNIFKDERNSTIISNQKISGNLTGHTIHMVLVVPKVFLVNSQNTLKGRIKLMPLTD